MVKRAVRAICMPNGGPCCGECGPLVEQARAVIAAIREPTVEMEIAGTEYWALRVAMEDRSAGVWRAMIDAARAE